MWFLFGGKIIRLHFDLTFKKIFSNVTSIITVAPKTFIFQPILIGQVKMMFMVLDYRVFGF